MHKQEALSVPPKGGYRWVASEEALCQPPSPLSSGAGAPGKRRRFGSYPQQLHPKLADLRVRAHCPNGYRLLDPQTRQQAASPRTGPIG